ncbi:HTH domain-containing protein [Staphylococcus sp. GDK8D64P]|uniref:HTH domain-containing protein n=1 Tax=Staphylococcus sp. GDK8D64P TaxID=2804091 RepID=UPI001AEBC2ED|nr:HTH domain-containing protein [Staphylococcus sp. GDK8D64P]
MDKSERLLYIFTRLFNGKKLSKEELAQQLNVNVRSIQRDFSDINNFLYEDHEWEGLNARIVYENNIGRHRISIDRYKFKNNRLLNLLFRMKNFTPHIHIDTYNLFRELNSNSNLAEKFLSNTLLNQFTINHELTESTLIYKIQLAIQNKQIILLNDVDNQTYKVVPVYTRYFKNKYWITYIYQHEIFTQDLNSIQDIEQYDEAFDENIFLQVPTVIMKFRPSIWEQIQRQFIVLNSQNNEAFIEAELIISKNECLNLAYEYPQEIILLKPDHYVEDFKNQIKSLFKHYHI